MTKVTDGVLWGVRRVRLSFRSRFWRVWLWKEWIHTFLWSLRCSSAFCNCRCACPSAASSQGWWVWLRTGLTTCVLSFYLWASRLWKELHLGTCLNYNKVYKFIYHWPYYLNRTLTDSFTLFPISSTFHLHFIHFIYSLLFYCIFYSHLLHFLFRTLLFFWIFKIIFLDINLPYYDWEKYI